MIKKLLATTALIAVPLAASAADLPLKAPPVRVAEFTWEGWYIGGTFGYAGSKVQEDSSSAVVSHGFTGGLHGGYNWQSGNIVYGIEADVAATSAFGHTSNGASTAFSTQLTATLRGRLGFTFNRSLLYATGGLSYLHARTLTDDNNEEVKSHDLFGYVVGGGWEYAYNRNLIFRVVEAQYHGYHKTIGFDCPSSCNESASVKDVITVRTGFSYKF